MLNDLGLPRDPALRSMEVVKRLKNQGVPWRSAVADHGSWSGDVRRCQDDVINPGNSGKVGGLNQLTADKNI